MITGKIYQYCVIRSRLLSIASATIDEMRTSDFFNSFFDIGACFAMKPRRSKLSLILYGHSIVWHGDMGTGKKYKNLIFG
jgi:hypothetical protein